MTLDLVLGIMGLLLLLCVFANRISDRFGIPALLVFLAVGMLAGDGGLGQIKFYDAKLSNSIGTIALAFILFSGGLDTKWGEVKPIIFRGGILATLGVFLTAFFLFIGARYIVGLSFEVSLLLSVIVSSTDAPAVFSILRAQKAPLKGHLKPMLEFESGSNDPMAVLLSMGAISLLTAPDFNLLQSSLHLILEIGLGIAMGLGCGKLAAYYLGRWHLLFPGLYPVFGIGLVLLTYSLTQLIGGSGFLAVYLCGIFMGNTIFMHRRQFIKFQDSLSWIMQIGMFLILGLLVTPPQLVAVLPISIGCAIILMFIARPLAVFACLFRSEHDFKEKLFISWAGFKGAVPIILATYPMMINFPNSQFLFNLIFFLVIFSVLFQGKTLSLLIQKLDLFKYDSTKPEPLEKSKKK